MNQLLGSSITYCIAIGPQALRKLFSKPCLLAKRGKGNKVKESDKPAIPAEQHAFMT